MTIKFSIGLGSALVALLLVGFTQASIQPTVVCPSTITCGVGGGAVYTVTGTHLVDSPLDADFSFESGGLVLGAGYFFTGSTTGGDHLTAQSPRYDYPTAVYVIVRVREWYINCSHALVYVYPSPQSITYGTAYTMKSSTGPVVIHGQYFGIPISGYACYMVWVGVDHTSTSLTSFASCNDTTLVMTDPLGPAAPSGCSDPYGTITYCKVEVHWGDGDPYTGIPSPGIGTGVNYVYPTITSLSPPYIMDTGSTLTVTGTDFGTSLPSFVTAMEMRNADQDVRDIDLSWVSSYTDTQIIINFPAWTPSGATLPDTPHLYHFYVYFEPSLTTPHTTYAGSSQGISWDCTFC